MRGTYRFIGMMVVLGIGWNSFLSDPRLPTDPVKPVPVAASIQRKGSASNGYAYLTTGDYVRGGLPLEVFALVKERESKNDLLRKGINKGIPYNYTAITASNGVQLVAPNCLQCHARPFNDSLIIGLGNSLMDFSTGDQLNAKKVHLLARLLKAGSPEKYEASKNFLRVAGTVGPLLKTSTRGVNVADRLAAVLVAHRDPVTLQWRDTASMPIPEEIIPSDVPAWWLLRKKNAMFYTGFGRGDFGRFLMASNLLTVSDTNEAAQVDKQISDVLAYLYTIRPPKFPGEIDGSLVSEGERVFNNSCSKCHGTYGVKETFPNLLIPAAIIKTDSALYSSNYQNPQFVEWFNNSWFSQSDHPAMLVPFEGYMAPPLDGIWCTAPYLHNGSVPTLEALLNSSLRPVYWSGNFSAAAYDYERIGCQYRSQDSPGGSDTYNTTLRGYGNYGHNFGDKLTGQERKALLEYLKTL